MPSSTIAATMNDSGVGDHTGQRVVAVDALRGAAVSICVMAAVGVPFLFTLPQSSTTQFLIEQLSHSVWHGVTLLDFAQPLFLTIMGTAVVLSYRRRRQVGQSASTILRHAVLRAVVLFLIGVLIGGWLAIPGSGVRLAGPLQQIAICYLIAAVLVPVTKWPIELGAIVLLLVNYTLLLELFPGSADEAAAYSIDQNLGAMIDGQWLPGRKYFGTWDPYGYATLLPAMALTLAGMVLGRLVITSAIATRAKLFGLLVCGGLLINNGLLLSEFVPVNPYLATTPFVMIALGTILLGYAVCLFLTGEPMGTSTVLAPLAAIGRNSLVVIVVLHLLSMDIWSRRHFGNAINDWLGNVAGLAVSLIQLTLLGLVVWWLAHKKWTVTV